MDKAEPPPDTPKGTKPLLTNPPSSPDADAADSDNDEQNHAHPKTLSLGLAELIPDVASIVTVTSVKNPNFKKLTILMKMVFIVLCTVPLLMVSYVEDSPGAIAPLMNQTGLGGADSVGYLYTFYFLLVPFYCIYSGLVIDSGGFALALSSGLLLTLFGTLTTTMAAMTSSYPLMLLGRMMSGGCEAVESTLLAYIAIVCRGSLKWEGFAFALSNAMLNLGNVILFFLVPPLLQYGYLYSLGSTVILSIFAILATVAIICIDRRLELTKERDPDVKESIQLSAIWNQTSKFWLITYLSASNLGIYFNILSFCVLYEYNAGYSTETSGYIPALCSMISLLSPLAMLLIDRYRIHNIVLFVGAIVNVACFFFLSLELPYPFLFFISMGVVYTTSDPIYLELIANEVHQNFLGTAFSLQTIVHAVLHILYPAIGGWISVRFGWFGFFLFFFGCSLVNFVILVVYFLLAKKIIGGKYAII